MKLWRRPGSFVAFIDSVHEESLLKIEADMDGRVLFSFCLYDSNGTLVQDSSGQSELAPGHEIRSADNELLLQVPLDADSGLQYRLYSRTGRLITSSDGVHTQILLGLRMEGNKPLAGRPPNAAAGATNLEPAAANLMKEF